MFILLYIESILFKPIIIYINEINNKIKKRNNKWKEIAQATPRIILAIIIAVVISKPLELKLFEKEINQVLFIVLWHKQAQSINGQYQQE